ncbi:MAG: 3-hydroxyacyl-CoA dehydrogenase NAD-binding domain-containing protein [Chloroflexi bacterium]|nr:3-hydroxyacyl-CoA dehydrogenase NAD-binding domain-containing protein [Chloroflexota bacterium]
MPDASTATAPTPLPEIKKVAIIGAGTMGAGIAQVAVQHGYATVLRDIDQALIDRGIATVEKGLGRLVDKGRLGPAERDAALARLGGGLDLDALADADLVLEAASERLDIKRAIFAELDEACSQARVLASNSSSLSNQNLAGVTKRPGRVIGLHFFNPAPVLPLVEVIVPYTADEEVVELGERWVRSLGKQPVRAKDTPGFIANRLLVPFILDAFRLLESGVASAEDIDTACHVGFNHAMGPLATADLIGLDVMLDIAEAMQAELHEPSLAAPTMLRRYVEAGWLGRKSGRGVYRYD